MPAGQGDHLPESVKSRFGSMPGEGTKTPTSEKSPDKPKGASGTSFKAGPNDPDFSPVSKGGGMRKY